MTVKATGTESTEQEGKLLEHMTQNELRQLCIEQCKADGNPSSWVQISRKADLIAFLNGDEPTVTTKNNPGAPEVAAGGIADMLAQMARNAVDEAVSKTDMKAARPLIVNFDKAKSVRFDKRPHARMMDVLKTARWEENILLVGPAGTGKTTIAEDVAFAMDRPFNFLSLSAGVTETHLWGRMLPGAAGEWVFQESNFVKVYRDGGVFLLDEVDAADANVMVGINAALANGQLSNPYNPEAKPIPRHPECLIIAAANTFGRGADRLYVGRNALDAATLDRFTLATLEINYDIAIESHILSTIGDRGLRKSIGDWVSSLRSMISKGRLRRIASTRLVVNATKMANLGATLKDITEAFFVDWSDDEKAKVGA